MFFRLASSLLMAASFVFVPPAAAREGPAVRLKARLPVSKKFWQFALGPDGRTLAVAHTDRFVRLWDVETGELKATTAAKIEADAADPVWSPDGRMFLTYAHYEPKRFSVWDARTGALLWSVGSKERIQEPVWSPDGRSILTVFEGWRVRLYDAAGGRVLVELSRESVVRAAFSPDGHTLLTTAPGWFRGSLSEGARLWDAATGELKLALEQPCGGEECLPGGPALSPDGRTLAVTTRGRDIYLYDARTGRVKKRVAKYAVRDSYELKGFSPGGRWLVTTRTKGLFSMENWVELRDPETGEVKVTLAAKDFQMAWSADGRRLVTTNHPKDKYTAYVWEAEAGRLLATTPLLGDRFFRYDYPDRIQFTAGGRVLGAAGDKSVRFWDAEAGETLLEEEGASAPMQVSRDGTLAVGRSKKGNAVFVWEITGG